MNQRDIAEREQAAFKAGWNAAKHSLFTNSELDALARARYPTPKTNSTITLGGWEYRWNTTTQVWERLEVTEHIRPRSVWDVWSEISMEHFAELPAEIQHALIELKRGAE